MKDDIQNSIELDKAVLIDSPSPNSIRSCFKYLRSFSPNHFPNQMHWKHIKASTNIQIANLFNSYFSSVYQTSNSTVLPIAENPLVFLQDMTVEISMVEALLSSASSNCSNSGSIPTFVFSSCPGLLAPLVTQLFITNIKSKQWPDFWKCSTIKPILKSGNPENVESYCLVSNLPQLSLILEKNIIRFIYPQIRSLICDQQLGFFKNRPTVTQLLPYLDQLYLQLDVNGPSLSVYFGFFKAFDRVSHHKLLQK